MVKRIYFYNKIELYTSDLPSLLVLSCIHTYHYITKLNLYVMCIKNCKNTVRPVITHRQRQHFCSINISWCFIFLFAYDRVSAIIKSNMCFLTWLTVLVHNHQTPVGSLISRMSRTVYDVIKILIFSQPRFVLLILSWEIFIGELSENWIVDIKITTANLFMRNENEQWIIYIV